MARRNTKAGPGHPILTEVYLGTPENGGAGQFLRLHNPGRRAARLIGWSVGDGSSWATFRAGARLPAGDSLYLARDPSAFEREMGRAPDLLWSAGTMAGGEALQLRAEGGWIGLRDGKGRLRDAVAWGARQGELPGWRGEPVPVPRSGEIIDRGRTEPSILEGAPPIYQPDTDTAADWKQGGSWLDARAYRPGQTWYGAPQFKPERVTLYSTPDSTYSLLRPLIDGAEMSIDLEVYDFTIVELAERLAAAAARGVRIRLLIEGGTVAGLFPQERWVAEQVAAAGGEVRWILNDPKAGFTGRYVYDHSKWGVVDGARVFVQSENWVRHGISVDPSFGNRGWGALVEDRAFAAYLTQVFESDWSPTHGDVQPFGEPRLGGPGPEFKPERSLLTGRYPAPFKAFTLEGEIGLTPVLTPEHGLLETGGIIGLIRSARTSLLIQQQYVHLHWGPPSGDPTTTPNLFLAEAIEAARRGVQVRIQLSDAFLNPKDPKDNTATVAYVNGIAAQERLALEARLINSKAAGLDKIHNKGMVVDGARVLISSINWSLNSPANNRELGVILEHPLIGRYFSDLFQYDWSAGQPPSGVLIAGVDRGAGSARIQNHGADPLSLDGWALATAAGRWPLPALTIPPGGAVSLSQAELGATFTLRPEGERLGLLQGEREIDAVEWGEAALYARMPLPPGTGPLCRTDGPDTNTALDWRTDCEAPGARKEAGA